MKTGIMVRVGKINYDLTELPQDELVNWVVSLERRQQQRLIIVLLKIIQRIDANKKP